MPVARSSLPRYRGARASILAAAALLLAPGIVCAQGVQVSKLSDVGFGTIADVTADQSQSQSVCAYSGVAGGRYSVTASGSGSGGAFTLSNGAALLPYEVQWNSAAGSASGTNLSPNVPLNGQVSTLSLPNCSLLASSGSLIVLLRGTALSAAAAGNYSGSLTILLSPN